jgi:hypothetical protein
MAMKFADWAMARPQRNPSGFDVTTGREDDVEMDRDGSELAIKYVPRSTNFVRLEDDQRSEAEEAA